MEEGILYYSEEFELAGLRCACGCGHRITLLVPDSHQVFDQGGWATVRPSIGVFDAPCRSHYIISASGVEWLPAFTGAEAASIMHTQIARHVAHDPKRLSWPARIVAWAKRILASFAEASRDRR
jgi:hypothetical protein